MDTFEEGANCQLFIYTILREMGFLIPDFRSSNLWEDSLFSMKVDNREPLDIVFFNSRPEPYAAHIGLFLGNDCIIHLSQEEGRPTFGNMQQFLEKERYRYFLGTKRLKSRKI